jgi:hypothetical protein
MPCIFAFFARFKVTIFAKEFCGVFWRENVRIHTAILLIEKTPKLFLQKKYKKLWGHNLNQKIGVVSIMV